MSEYIYKREKRNFNSWFCINLIYNTIKCAKSEGVWKHSQANGHKQITGTLVPIYALSVCAFFPEGRACAVVFDCKFIETSASLQHNVAELFEGVVRQIRLRQDGSEAIQRRRSIYKRKESITQKARRFLDRLVARNNQRMAVKVRSKSCHDLAVLWRHGSTRIIRLDFFLVVEVLASCDIEDKNNQQWAEAVDFNIITVISVWPTRFPVWPFGLNISVTFSPDDINIKKPDDWAESSL